MDIKSLFNKIPFMSKFQQTQGQHGALPFVQMFGHEKSYGKPPPRDFLRMVAHYHSWAYACAQKNGFSVAKVKGHLFTKNAEGELEEYKKEHPFLELLKTVNPHSNRFQMMALTQIYIELTGNAYWWMPKGAFDVPAQIWNLPTHWMSVVPDKEKFIKGYVMQVPGKGQKIPFDEEEIVHFKFPEVYSLFYGDGPLYAASYGIDLNDEMKTWQINYFKNNAQPGGVLATEQSMTPDQYKRLREEWNRKYKGSKNAGKIAFLEGGLKYSQIGSSMEKMKVKEISREQRDEILALFGVPASKLGLVEDVNRANAEVNDYTYQKETIEPRLTLFEEKINEKVMPMYDERLIFKFENNIPEDRDFKLRERETNIRSGFASIDEEREKEGLEPYNLPETKVPLIPFSLSPAGTPKPEPQPFGGGSDDDKDDDKKKAFQKSTDKWDRFILMTVPQENVMEQDMREFFQKQHSEVIKNLDKLKSVKKDILAYIMFNLKDEISKLNVSSRSNIRNAFVGGLMLGISDTGEGIDFNLFEPNIIRAVESRVNFFASTVNETTAGLLKDEIVDALNLGESIPEISKRVDTVFNFSEKYRSKRIARTEVIGATNDGQLAAYNEAGMKGKAWITARDEKVRSSHQIDGQVVEITASFTTLDGSKLNYPGDRSTGAPAGDIINCRCTVRPIKNIGE